MSSFSSTTTLAQSDTASHYLFPPTSNSCVINSSATEHMTGVSTHLSDYHIASSPQSVTLTKVKGFGSTHLSLDLELLYALHIPGFPLNLLSISKLTEDL